MYKWIIVFLVSIPVMISSCSSKKALLIKDYKTGDFYINGVVSGIEIFDYNSGFAENSLDIPKEVPRFSHPGMESIETPPLLAHQIENIKIQINSYFKGYDYFFSVKCYLIEGVKGFKGGLLIEKEYAKITMKIELYDFKESLIHESFGIAELEAKSLDASDKYLNKLYNKTLEIALYNCLYKLNEKMRPNM